MHGNSLDAGAVFIATYCPMSGHSSLKWACDSWPLILLSLFPLAGDIAVPGQWAAAVGTHETALGLYSYSLLALGIALRNSCDIVAGAEVLFYCYCLLALDIALQDESAVAGLEQLLYSRYCSPGWERNSCTEAAALDIALHDESAVAALEQLL